MLRRTVSNALYATAEFAAQSYVAGRELRDALRVCDRLKTRCFKFTICPWDRPGDSPDAIYRSYVEALSEILASPFDLYLSIKVPSLKYDTDKIRSLLRSAAAGGKRVHFDAIAPETQPRTLDIARELAGEFRNIGVTLPARWRRSLDDARALSAAPIAIRIVKGQWADPGFDDRGINGNFLQIARALGGRSHTVAVASHDAELAKQALDLLIDSKTRCELEQLFGLPYLTGRYWKERGIPMRIYVPYGAGYLPYAVSMAKKKPVVLWWLLRDAALSRLQA